MSKGINKAIILGNLGQDPEIRYMPNGNAVTNISLATSETWKDKQTGQPQECTEWHRIVFFNRLAEVAGEYLRKGSKVYVEGSLRTRKWQDQSGQDRYTTEIVAKELQMLDRRQNTSQGHAPATIQGQAQPPQQNGNYGQQPAGYGQVQQRQTAPPQQPQQQQAPQQFTAAQGFNDFTDDIPF